MTGAPVLVHLAIGPPTHGVTRCAERVYRALRTAGFDDHRLVVSADAAGALVALPGIGNTAAAHLHVTDRLYGLSPKQAAEQFVSLVDAVGVPVSVTLHDIPQPSDGARMADRVACYRTVLRAATDVTVCSDHEAALLREFVDADATVQVVPLIVEPIVGGQVPVHYENAVAVLGFLYPGKGHIETLRAMAELDPSVAFVALGTPSPGHDDLADELRSVAAASGRRCEITGYLDDAELDRRVRSVAVPVAFHRHMSASGSIATWVSAGRRPVVPRTRYTEELHARSPGVLNIHEDGDGALRIAIAAALADRDATLLDEGVAVAPTPEDVARQYDRIVRECAR